MKMKDYRDFLFASKTYGGSKGQKRRNPDNGSNKAPMKQGVARVFDAEHETSPNFGAIDRWLKSKIGQSMDSVMSELTKLCGKSVGGLRLKKYFLDCIANSEGKLPVNATSFVIRDGLLCLKPKRSKTSIFKIKSDRQRKPT